MVAGIRYSVNIPRSIRWAWATKNSFVGISETKFLSVVFSLVTFQASQTFFRPQRGSPFANLVQSRRLANFFLIIRWLDVIAVSSSSSPREIIANRYVGDATVASKISEIPVAYVNYRGKQSIENLEIFYFL